MTISGVGSSLVTSPVYPASSADATSSSDPSDSASLRRSQRTQFRSDFASLLSAVKSGDMSAAQQALAAVQKDQSAAGATYSGQSSQSKGPLSNDVQSLFTAVQQGDASAAQQALTQFHTDAQQQMQSRGAGGHGHHHHHHHSSTDATSATTSPADGASALVGTSTPNE